MLLAMHINKKPYVWKYVGVADQNKTFVLMMQSLILANMEYANE